MGQNSIENILSDAVDAARLNALEMLQRGSLAHLARVVGMSHASNVSLVSASLLQAMLFCAEQEYVSSEGVNLSLAVLKGLTLRIGEIGDVKFNDGFSRVWFCADRDLRGPAVAVRLSQLEIGTSYRRALLEVCAEWSLKMMFGGVVPSEISNDIERYNSVIEDYSNFCEKRLVGLDSCAIKAEASAGPFNFDSIPVGTKTYDVFISYKRRDGDVGARLINQELKYRGYSSFLDVENMHNGAYNYQILSSLRAAKNVLFFMSPGAVEEFVGADDPVRIELEAAQRWCKRITVVALPDVNRNLDDKILPPTLGFLRTIQIYRLNVGEFYEASVDRIIRLGLGLGA